MLIPDLYGEEAVNVSELFGARSRASTRICFNRIIPQYDIRDAPIVVGW